MSVNEGTGNRYNCLYSLGYILSDVKDLKKVNKMLKVPMSKEELKRIIRFIEIKTKE